MHEDHDMRRQKKGGMLSYRDCGPAASFACHHCDFGAKPKPEIRHETEFNLIQP